MFQLCEIRIDLQLVVYIKHMTQIRGHQSEFIFQLKEFPLILILQQK